MAKKILISLFLIVLAVLLFRLFISDKIVRARDINLLEVDCDKQDSLLQVVYKRDQKVRASKVDFRELIESDYQNLEIVTSIIEKCGIPTSEDISKKHFVAMWSALQHSPQNKYRKEYLDEMKVMHLDGNITNEQMALFEDKILIDDRRPQKYGTQISRGKLYKVDNMDSVKVRRENLGLEPLEAYLKKFDISLDE